MDLRYFRFRLKAIHALIDLKAPPVLVTYQIGQVIKWLNKLEEEYRYRYENPEMA